MKHTAHIFSKEALTCIERINVAAVIFNSSGEVLLTKRAASKKFLPNHWHLPGGKIEVNEEPEQALKREISEELSLSIIQCHNLQTGFVYPKKDSLHCTYFYLVKSKGEIQLDFENDDYTFLRPKHLGNYLTGESFIPSQRAITTALAVPNQESWRSSL